MPRARRHPTARWCCCCSTPSIRERVGGPGQGRLRPGADSNTAHNAIESRLPDGHVGLGESYGTHINVSFGSCPGETSDDIVRTLKRLLTITWIVEDHVFGVLCPDREAHCGPYLSSTRDWPEPTTPGSEGASSPACREMEEDLPHQLVSERGREMELI